MADHYHHHRQHSYLRHGSSRILSLFGDGSDNFVAVGNTTTASNLLAENNSLPPETTAPWSTRKTILFAECIAVTAIVIPLLFCFLYNRASKSGHLPTRLNSSSQTPTQLHGANGANNAIDAAAAAEVMTSDRALRILQQQQSEEFHPPEQQQAEDQQLPPPTLLQRLTTLPSTLRSILLYPFRAIDAGIHSWSTTNADITFLRSVMERLEEERVAQLEDVEERGKRLKLAFSKGDSVWEIAEEHFVPPPTLYALSPSSPDMIEKCVNRAHNITATFANGNEKGHGVEERELGEDNLSEEELKRVDNNHDDATNTADGAMNTANVSAVDSIASATVDNKEEVESDNSKGETNKVDSINVEREGSDQNHQLSSLMMDETIDQDRPVSPLMIDEEGEIVRELTPPPPSRSSSPLYTGEAPAFLYLPNRKIRSRTNTNETTTSTANMTLFASSSNLSQRSFVESLPSNSSHTNNSTKIDNSADDRNNAFDEEELKSVPNNCAICLSEYVSGDTIVTSCDPMCPHAFHQECIVEWLVKMQVGAPCPCCRRTFVELSPPAAATTTTVADGVTTGEGVRDGNTNNSVRRATASPEEEERRREELRRTIRLGIRRGRAFDFSVISFR